jgi:hypothetical protein
MILRRISYWVSRQAYPHYECECCIGQEWWRGCYCQYHDCIGPCEEPRMWHRFWRRVEPLTKKLTAYVAARQKR